jgi:hypothetical protein
MDKKTLNRIGLAAAILLVPGGFILGATLAAQRYRKRATPETVAPDAAEAAEAVTDERSPAA